MWCTIDDIEVSYNRMEVTYYLYGTSFFFSTRWREKDVHQEFLFYHARERMNVKKLSFFLQIKIILTLPLFCHAKLILRFDIRMKEQCKAPMTLKSLVWMQGMFMSTLINAAFKILSIISLLKNQLDINLMRASPCAFHIVNKN